MIYLDVGSNIGVQVRKLFEPDKYPEAPVLPVFSEVFGDDRGRRVCAVGFEMNPSHTQRLQEVQAAYTACGFRVHFFTEVAVSNANGTVPFWSNRDVLEVGASIFDRFVDSRAEAAVPVWVRALDLVHFLEHEVLGHAPTVMMKMDIEGAELLVLPGLLARGLLCRVAALTLEFHEDVMLDGDRRELEALRAALPIVLTRGGCRSRLLLLDDESYSSDAERPWPQCLSA